MSLSHTVSEINCDFSLKLPIFPTSCVFNAPAGGVPLGLGTGAGGQKTSVKGLPG